MEELTTYDHMIQIPDLLLFTVKVLTQQLILDHLQEILLCAFNLNFNLNFNLQSFKTCYMTFIKKRHMHGRNLFLNFVRRMVELRKCHI